MHVRTLPVVHLQQTYGSGGGAVYAAKTGNGRGSGETNIMSPALLTARALAPPGLIKKCATTKPIDFGSESRVVHRVMHPFGGQLLGGRATLPRSATLLGSAKLCHPDPIRCQRAIQRVPPSGSIRIKSTREQSAPASDATAVVGAMVAPFRKRRFSMRSRR